MVIEKIGGENYTEERLNKLIAGEHSYTIAFRIEGSSGRVPSWQTSNRIQGRKVLKGAVPVAVGPSSVTATSGGAPLAPFAPGSELRTSNLGRADEAFGEQLQ